MTHSWCILTLWQYVGMSVYNVMIMCVLGVAISAVLSEQRNSSFVLISVFIIFCTTLTLCLVFVPKVRHKSDYVAVNTIRIVGISTSAPIYWQLSFIIFFWGGVNLLILMFFESKRWNYGKLLNKPSFLFVDPWSSMLNFAGPKLCSF